MESAQPLRSIPDEELLRRLVGLMQESRRVEADLVAHIGEVDARRLYAREAAPSMFAYCTDILHLSEAEAYLRIATARASREHPILLQMLVDGRLHLTGIVRLAPHLTRENREALLKRAAHKSKRQIEELVAELSPRPDAPTLVRKLPERRPAAPLALELRPDRVASASRPAAPAPPRPVEPLAPARYKVQFTASAELRDKLERLQALMRSSVPDGDLAALIDIAVTEKLQRLEARRFARTEAPRKTLRETDTSPASRHVPAAVRRAVHDRDGGRCVYVDPQGRRCPAREYLELHHRRPYGHGGDHSPENLCLMCRAHNSYLAEVDYRTRGAAPSRSRPAPVLRTTPPAG
jgi:hypothetical protein